MQSELLAVSAAVSAAFKKVKTYSSTVATPKKPMHRLKAASRRGQPGSNRTGATQLQPGRCMCPRSPETSFPVSSFCLRRPTIIRHLNVMFMRKCAAVQVQASPATRLPCTPNGCQNDSQLTCSRCARARGSRQLASSLLSSGPHLLRPAMAQAGAAGVDPTLYDRGNAPTPSIYHQISGTGAPWEIRRPQPFVIELVKQGAFNNREVLDIGCCIGDNAMYIAKNAPGVKLTAFDFVERALNIAKQRAAEAGADIEFLLADATDIDSGPLAGRTFQVVVDSAIYHCFGEEDRYKYVWCLGKLLRPGGKYYQLVFSEKEPPGRGPRHISKGEIHETFNEASGWKVEEIRDYGLDAKFEDVGDRQVKGYFTTMTRLG